jgi:hypothetical protein
MTSTLGKAPRFVEESIVKANTFIRAAEILGGIGSLAAYLGAEQGELLAWMSGAMEPPSGAFLLAVDLILEDGGTSHPLPKPR